jgi:membrane protease YdiL (CAAX protease family)
MVSVDDMLLTFGLLGAAIVAVWLPDVRVGEKLRLPPWQLLFVAAVVAGLASGILTWPAPFALAAIWCAAWASRHAQRQSVSDAWTALAALLALLLAVHLAPGFTSPVVAANVKLSADSAPMTLRANFDKGAAGLVLLAYCCHRARKVSEWPAVLGIGTAVGLATAVVVVSLASGIGAVRLDPKLPSIAPAWFAINLMLTCVTEEAFFRGIVQERLARAVAESRYLRHVPIAVTSVLFGLAHAGGGPWLILAATLAGIGYGTAYRLARCIEAAIVAHFLVNAVHFLGFTYPYAVR